MKTGLKKAIIFLILGLIFGVIGAIVFALTDMAVRYLPICISHWIMAIICLLLMPCFILGSEDTSKIKKKKKIDLSCLDSDFDYIIPLKIQLILMEWEAEVKESWCEGPFPFMNYLWYSESSTLLILSNDIGAMIGPDGKREQKYKKKLEDTGLTKINIHFKATCVLDDAL